VIIFQLELLELALFHRGNNFTELSVPAPSPLCIKNKCILKWSAYRWRYQRLSDELLKKKK
jgi:hypothetical protein